MQTGSHADYTHIIDLIDQANTRWPSRELGRALTVLRKPQTSRDDIARVEVLVSRVHERRRARDLHAILSKLHGLSVVY